MKPLHHVLLGLYGGLWRAAAPFLRRNKRLAEGFEERLLPDGWPYAHDKPGGSLRMWIQAASGGEAWLLHSLVPALVREMEARAGRQGAESMPPRLEALCTTCTRQGLEVLEKLSASAGTPSLSLLPRYFPLDRPDLMRRALTLFPPHMVILLETELWPGLLSATREAGVPVLAINGRMTEKSLSAYRVMPSFWRAFAPRRVLAVSPDDARRFAALFGEASQIGVMPNIKFDRAAESLDQARQEAPRRTAAGLRAAVGCPEDVLLVALASVREEEEDMLLPSLKALRSRKVDGAPLMLAVAPRHMHRVPAWREKLDASGIPFSLRSAGAGPNNSGPLPICLWDKFGELQALYAIADAVFVGGSLAPLGGQNFLEPLAQGVCPLVGPHVENFLWVGEDVFSSGLAVKLAGPEALEDALISALSERGRLLPEAGATTEQWRAARAEAGAAVRKRFAAWLEPRAGGSAQAARAVLETALVS